MKQYMVLPDSVPKPNTPISIMYGTSKISLNDLLSPWAPPKLKNFSIIASPKRISAGPMLIQLTALWLRRLWPKLARDPKYLGAQIGLISVLHTWGQNLLHHPHLHCIVPGGGLSLDGRRWINSKKKFFIPIKVLSRKFRGKFLALFKQAVQNGEITFTVKLHRLAANDAFSP